MIVVTVAIAARAVTAATAAASFLIHLEHRPGPMAGLFVTSTLIDRSHLLDYSQFMATQAARRRSTRQAILQAAARLFRGQGYDETSVDQIVETADVAKGTFYQYFQTKIEVALAIVEAERAELFAEIESQLAAGADALELASKTYLDMARWFEANRHFARPLLLHTLQSQHDPSPASTRTLLTRLLSAAQQQGQLRRDIPAETLAAVAAGSIIPMVFHWTAHGEPGQLPLWFAVSWKLHLEGSLPRPGEGSSVC